MSLFRFILLLFEVKNHQPFLTVLYDLATVMRIFLNLNERHRTKIKSVQDSMHILQGNKMFSSRISYTPHQIGSHKNIRGLLKRARQKNNIGYSLALQDNPAKTIARRLKCSQVRS